MMDAASAGPSRGFIAATPGDRSRESHASDLPDGFLPLRRVKALALQGRWATLDDRMPPWLPFHCLVEMARRDGEGDADAHAWLELYRRASQGDAVAQREMGHACETGACGTQVDVHRAFFWYYRAGLAGDLEGTECALRLKEAFAIAPAAMEEPALLYAGQWRITRDDLDGTIATAVYDLAEDGTMATATSSGTWHYDRTRRTLTLASPKPWRIRLIGCRETTLFGRDQHLVTYVIERAAPFKGLRPR
jgi:TPR repeat protein